MRYVLRAAVIVLLEATALEAAAFSLADAQRRALEIAPQVAGAEATIRASREMAIAAGRRPDPVAKLGLENLPIEGPDRFDIGNDFMTMRRIGVMQEFTRGDKLRARSERFSREAEKNAAERAAAIATVQRETANAWLERYYAEAAASAIAEQRQEAVRESEAAEANYRAGRAAQTDVFAARAAIVGLEDRLNEAQAKVAVSMANLARWAGPASREPLSERPSLDSIPTQLLHIHTAVAHHPEVQVARKNEEIAAAEVAIARSNRKPDWTWEVAYSRRGSAYSDMVSIGVSVPIPWDRANKQDREVAAKLAQVDQAAAQRDEIFRMHTAELESLVVEWQNGHRRQRRISQELIPIALQRTQAALAAYSGGRGSLADVLLARRAELEARLQLLQLELDTARVWAKLNFLFPVDLAMKDQ